MLLTGNQLKGKSISLPLQSSDGDSLNQTRKTPLSRTKSSVPNSEFSDTQNPLVPTKSQSVENIEGSYRGPPPGYSAPPPAMWGATPWPETHDTVNLHRKLQRQLTLNPVCDPRLYQMRQHQTVGRVMSCEPPPPPPHYTTHQHVTRIASAPPSHPSAPLCPVSYTHLDVYKRQGLLSTIHVLYNSILKEVFGFEVQNVMSRGILKTGMDVHDSRIIIFCKQDSVKWHTFSVQWQVSTACKLTSLPSTQLQVYNGITAGLNITHIGIKH